MFIGSEKTTEGTLFHFSSTWSLPSDLPAIWNAIGAIETWPTWWPSIRNAHVLEGASLPVLVGSRAQYNVQSPLGYALLFRSEITHVQEGEWIESVIDGDLRGTGRWEFAPSKNQTNATLLWDVAITPSFLVPVAELSLGRRAMSWAHNRVMVAGEKGLREKILRDKRSLS